jgi:hypothetical protein
MNLRNQAEHYASALVIGDQIRDDVDGETIAGFRHLLPGVLSLRGLILDLVKPGIYVVKQAPWATAVMPPRQRPSFQCRTCWASWFACDHGPGSFIFVPWPGVDAATLQPAFPVRAKA